MKITARIKTNTRIDAVFIKEGIYIVSVKALPIEGRANEAIEKVLAKYFKIAPSLVRVVNGKISKNKIVEINI